MGKVLNFGSINIDHVYRVDHFVRPGETLNCQDYQRFAGGKGLNQSLALSHAGAKVFHAGKVGKTDSWLKELLQQHGVETLYIQDVDSPSGHAMIQVNSEGENSIVLYGGANRKITQWDAETILKNFSSEDCLLIQNEVSAVPEIIHVAKAQGLTVALNPAPMTPEVKDYPLECVDLLIVNEIEAQDLSGQNQVEAIRSTLQEQYPEMTIVLTLGKQGAWFLGTEQECFEPAVEVEPVDTTAAGDTFIGYFLAEWMKHHQPEKALEWGCRAAGVCVTKQGAADSIPYRKDL